MSVRYRRKKFAFAISSDEFLFSVRRSVLLHGRIMCARQSYIVLWDKNRCACSASHAVELISDGCLYMHCGSTRRTVGRTAGPGSVWDRGGKGRHGKIFGWAKAADKLVAIAEITSVCKQPKTSKYVDPSYCLTEMYAVGIVYCFRVGGGEYADGTDGQRDARPFHYAFR